MKICGKIAAAVLCACALLAGCGDGEKPEQSENANGTPNKTVAPSQTVRDLLERSDAAIEYVVLPLAVPERVNFETDDGATLAADYYPGKDDNPAGVILVHSFYGTDRRDWDALIDDLVAKGYAVLAFDLRDHGESVRTSMPVGRGSIMNLSPEEFQKDFVAARDFFEKKGVPNDKTVVITSGDEPCAMLGTAHNCKGVICLLPNYCFDLQKLPTDWYYYFPEPNFTNAPIGSLEFPPSAKNYHMIMGESDNWELIEFQPNNPSDKGAQIEILKNRFAAMKLSDVYVRATKVDTVQIVVPEKESQEVFALFKSCKLEIKAEAPLEIVKKYAEADKAFAKTKAADHPAPPEGYEVYELDGDEWILVEAAPSIAGEDFAKFQASDDYNGRPAIGFRLRADAAQRFGDLTAKRHKDGRRLVIILDGEVLSAPGISEAIRGGNGIITLGGYDKSKNDRILERDRLLVSLQAGTLALPFKDMQHYLIVSMENGKAITAIYAYGILGRKFGDFDVNENILRDIETILAKRDIPQSTFKPVAPSSPQSDFKPVAPSS